MGGLFTRTLPACAYDSMCCFVPLVRLAISLSNPRYCPACYATVALRDHNFCGMIHTVKIRRYFPSHVADAVEAIERGEKIAVPVVFDLPDIHDAFPECDYDFVRNLIKCTIET